MTRDEQFIIENAGAGDDLDLLLATHRCADCAADAIVEVEGDDGVTLWLCADCAGERDAEGPALAEHHARAA
ncbi:hypothetical protein GCM10028798_16010 [Humibacter antri]